MARIAIVESKPTNVWAEAVLRALSARQKNEYYLASPSEIFRQAERNMETACVYVPPFSDHEGTTPDLHDAEAAFQQLAGIQNAVVVLISSALIYGIGPGRQTFAKEDYSPPGNGGKRICDQWNLLERTPTNFFAKKFQLPILRPFTVFPPLTVFTECLLQGLIRTLPVM